MRFAGRKPCYSNRHKSAKVEFRIPALQVLQRGTAHSKYGDRSELVPVGVQNGVLNTDLGTETEPLASSHSRDTLR